MKRFAPAATSKSDVSCSAPIASARADETNVARIATGARVLSALSLCALCGVLSGCSVVASLPRDQHGATERIRSERVLVVGASSETIAVAARHERRLVQKIAARLGARVQRRRGNAHALLEDLETLKLPLVAAGLSCDSPFSQSVGFSKPYLEDGPQHKDYCLAVAPGENRLLLIVDKIIAEEKQREKQSGDKSEAASGDEGGDK